MFFNSLEYFNIKDNPSGFQDIYNTMIDYTKRSFANNYKRTLLRLARHNILTQSGNSEQGCVLKAVTT